MPAPTSSRDPLHYKIIDALDDLTDGSPDSTVLADAVRAALTKAEHIECNPMTDLGVVARRLREAIAEALGVER